MAKRLQHKISRLIDTNRAFGGSIKSRNALEYGLEESEFANGKFKKLAYIIRPMLNDHCFWDGNKRTAAVVILSDLKIAGYDVDRKKLNNTIVSITENKISNLIKIEKMLRRCFKKSQKK